MTAAFKQGEIVKYSYLWHWQAERGETEGRKDRPVCVGLPIQKGGVTHLFLLAITSSVPGPSRQAMEIPETEARRAGLKGWKTGWVILDECNYDIAEHSHYLDSSQIPTGRFSEVFMTKVKSAFKHVVEQGSLARVDRLAD